MTKNRIETDAMIVGGGIIGLSLAWELASRGLDVCAVDSARFGRGASWAGAGILPASASRNIIDPYDQLRSLSHQLHREWAARLRDETGIDTGYRRCGGIYLARSVAESATLAANQSWWDEHGIEYQRWAPEELPSVEPQLAEICLQAKGAWLLPDDCQLRNPHHLQALSAVCRNSGVKLQENTEIQDFRWSDGAVVGAQTADGQVLHANSVCICAGAWTRRILTRLDQASGIMPVRGQMVLYRCPAPPLSRIVNEGHRYLVPRNDGYVLAGSVEEEVGYVCETTAEAIDQIRQWAEQVLPILSVCKVEATWAGLRPGSFDGLPYIGRVPNAKNLYVAAGHFRSGLHLSCATAVVMANLITGQPNEIDLSAFRVGRG